MSPLMKVTDPNNIDVLLSSAFGRAKVTIYDGSVGMIRTAGRSMNGGGLDELIGCAATYLIHTSKPANRRPPAD